MKTIKDIDQNFKVETKIEREGLKFFNPEEAPFKIYGVFREGDRFRRMPEAVAKTVSEGVEYLHTNTAGGRVRFVTDSPYVVINAKLDKNDPMDHFASTGISGFDLYVKEEGKQVYTGTFRLPSVPVNNYISISVPSKDFESIVYLSGEKKLREITINMPLYSDVKEFYIGLDENSQLKEHEEYKPTKPIVYYGPSTTQGGCATRPGMAYEAIIERELDIDYINLGFSGNAKGEQEMSDYIKNLDMSIFVLDYDHNAPTEEHLELTHEKMFKCVREANPDLPILML